MKRYRIYRVDNYILIYSEDGKHVWTGLAKNVRIIKNTERQGEYKILHVTGWGCDVTLNIGQILKQDGTPYTISEWEAWYFDNTGIIMNPGDYDLSEFNNNSSNPYITVSDNPNIKINTTNVLSSSANNILYSDGTKLQQASLGQDLEIVSGVIKNKDTLTSSSNNITFTRETIYGTASAPITNMLTLSNTSARLGLIQKVYYNNATLPTGLSVFQGLAFKPLELNILYLEWCGGSRYECWIAYEY